MKEEILYTPDEVAKKLKLSKYTIYEMIKRGEIPAHRIGRSLRITESQLQTFLFQSRRADNSYKAEIIIQDDEKLARIIDADDDLHIAVSTDVEGTVKVSIKPEDIIISMTPLVCSARNIIAGIVAGMEEMDKDYRITLNIGVPLVVNVTKRAVKEMNFKLGDTVYAVFKDTAVAVI